MTNAEIIKTLEMLYDDLSRYDDDAFEYELATEFAINLISNYEKAIRELEDELNNPMSTAESGGVNEYRVGIRYALKVLTKYMEGE